MYMNIEVVLIIGVFALLALAAGWSRMIYFTVRQHDAMQRDSRARAAAARQSYTAAPRDEQAGVHAH